MKLNYVLVAAVFAASFQASAQKAGNGFDDRIWFGNPGSEKAHNFSDDHSQIINGGLNQTARQLLPPETASWTGGKIAFELKVNPDAQTYITLKLWGNDKTNNRLFLLCEGKQVGYRHIGDIDMLDVGAEDPFTNDRFYYTTLPLPLALTKGKTMLHFEVHSNGPIWGYGQNWAQYQKDMTMPTRGIYALYTHTDPAFTPDASERLGKAPVAKLRSGPGTEVLDKIKQRVNNEINNELNRPQPLSQVQMQLLAKAYSVKWSAAYHNPKAVDRIINSLDAIYISYRKKPELAQGDPATPNADWFGLGITGQVLYLLKEPLTPLLSANVSNNTFDAITRKDAYTDMLVACRNWHQLHRRMYSNQSMINDLYGIYYANKGLQNINPGKALPENDMLRYFYESLGMQPWLGSETGNGPSRSAGDNYWELTKKGLTKELGYVGNYGEVLDWVSEIYDATRPAPAMPGDEKIKTQIEKIAMARAYFRYPAFDEQGYTAMRMETQVGWRDTHYPGDVTYMQRPSWDGTPLQIAAITDDSRIKGCAQQMLNDNQFFATLEKHLTDKGFRTTAGLLPLPDQYDIIKASKPVKYKLPMSADQPDFVFADEEDGVLAVKNGSEIFYASLYWRARTAVNYLARVHNIKPGYDRVATVHVDEEFEPSGLFYTRRDHTNLGFGNGGIKYPDGVHSANAGEKLPIAKIPDGVPYKFEDENPYAGRAQFYKLQYDGYLVGMNSSGKTFKLDIPAKFSNAKNIATGAKIGSVKQIEVKPGTTVVLYAN